MTEKRGIWQLEKDILRRCNMSGSKAWRRKGKIKSIHPTTLISYLFLVHTCISKWKKKKKTIRATRYEKIKVRIALIKVRYRKQFMINTCQHPIPSFFIMSHLGPLQWLGIRDHRSCHRMWTLWSAIGEDLYLFGTFWTFPFWV